jgi:hypothetical protein
MTNEKLNLVMLLSEIIMKFSQENTKHLNTHSLCKQIAKILALKRRDIQKLVNEI